jgi:hypothetical protein
VALSASIFALVCATPVAYGQNFSCQSTGGSWTTAGSWTGCNSTFLDDSGTFIYDAAVLRPARYIWGSQNCNILSLE